MVLEKLPNQMLLVETRDGAKVAVHASGAMRTALVRLVPGDAVMIQQSPFDPTKGRIIGIERGHPARVRRAPNESRSDSPRNQADRSSSDPETAP